MEKKEQERWNSLVKDHWWIRGHHLIARELIRVHLEQRKKKIRSLDIGCSGGYMLDFLKRFGNAYGFDMSFDGLRYCRTCDSGVVQADATGIPFKHEIFDAVLLLEISEHVENDRLLFEEVYRICADSAIVFVMIPAYQFLWGSHDVKYFHKRRYEKYAFINLVHRCKFKIKRLTYVHPHLLLPLIFIRYFDRLKKKNLGSRDDFMSLGHTLDGLLFKTLAVENKLIQRVDFPFGICMFATLEKK